MNMKTYTMDSWTTLASKNLSRSTTNMAKIGLTIKEIRKARKHLKPSSSRPFRRLCCGCVVGGCVVDMNDLTYQECMTFAPPWVKVKYGFGKMMNPFVEHLRTGYLLE